MYITLHDVPKDSHCSSVVRHELGFAMLNKPARLVSNNSILRELSDRKLYAKNHIQIKQIQKEQVYCKSCAELQRKFKATATKKSLAHVFQPQT